jgi:hypothetical protein
MRTLETIENSNDKDWQDRERWWIEAARTCGDPLTNLDGGGRNGFQKSEETRLKISMSNKGKKMSPEAVAKMKATKAARLTPEVRERLRQAQLGKKHSIESRYKRSESMRGHIISPETRRKIGEANRVAVKAYYASLPPKPPKPAKVPYVPSAETRLRMSIAAKNRKRKILPAPPDTAKSQSSAISFS